ncbi:MAG TPA: hypothetical protein VFR93_02265 [Candidatus Limnocylindrales bacterium]|nr:hypothetical protein [Candidatus Limnocylindrales bacterium]
MAQSTAFVRACPEPADELVGADALREVDAAIALVVGGRARRVRLAGVPFLDRVAGTALAHAHAAGLGFRLEPTDASGAATATIGPLDPGLAR